MSRTLQVAGIIIVSIGSAIAPIAGAAAAFKSLYSFQGGTDAVNPLGNLVRDKAGNLYGTAGYNNYTTCSGTGCGTVFEITPAGKESVLHTFTLGGSDGVYPQAGLYLDAKGDLYGATSEGGGSGCSGTGCGTLFKIAPGGTETVLYSFTDGSDGAYPNGALIADKNGNLYGTAQSGGTAGGGTVFEYSTTGNLTTLYSFQGGYDGAYPLAGLAVDSHGDFYGTTNAGGAFDWGTIFKLVAGGNESVLYAFDDSYGSEFGIPEASVTLDSSGDILTPVEQGGAYGCGVVFELTPQRVANVLYAFTGGKDGCGPYGNLITDASGNFYGTLQYGGTKYDGTVFKLTPAGVETTLHSFIGKDGQGPLGGLVADAKHNLYGATLSGGAAKDGTVFRVSE